MSTEQPTPQATVLRLVPEAQPPPDADRLKRELASIVAQLEERVDMTDEQFGDVCAAIVLAGYRGRAIGAEQAPVPPPRRRPVDERPGDLTQPGGDGYGAFRK